MTDQQHQRIVAHALQYLQRGWVVLPLHGKAPYDKAWPELRLGEAEIPQAFAPRDNLGLLLGEPSGHLVDVDLDGTYAPRLAPYLLPRTPMRHGRRGTGLSHWWYQSQLKATVKLQAPPTEGGQKAMLVEVRSTGGQTMVPPSIHPSGEEVRWADKVRFEPARVKARELLAAARQVAALELICRAWASGGRNQLAMHLGGWWAKAGVSREQAERWITAVCDATSDEDRGNRLGAVRASYDKHERGEQVAGAQELGALLGEAALRAAGDWLAIDGPPAAGGPGGTQEGGKPGVNEYAQRIKAQLMLNDEGNAHRFLSRHGDGVLHCALLGGWYTWDGARWRLDETHRALHLARETARAMREEALAIEAPVSLRSGALIPAQHARGHTLHWVTQTLTSGRLDALLALAASDERVAVEPDALDADALKLNVRNCTLDLTPEALLEGDPRIPHDPGLRLTKVASVDYDPQAGCPRWEQFLGEVLGGDEELISFMDRLSGYLLFGGNPASKIAFLWGTGGNGKGRWIGTLLNMLGDYAASTHSQTIVAREGGSNNQVYALARLKGTRLVMLDETDEGQMMAEGLVKSMTGGDRILARFSHGNFFEYLPEFTPVVATNHMPVLRNVDEAIRRRLLLIPFRIEIPPAERDLRLQEKLDAERSGILNRALAGLAEYYEREIEGLDPLGPPPAVLGATEAYLSEQDPIGEFLEARCELQAHLQCAKTPLYKAYESWCEEVGRRPFAANKFGGAVKRALARHYNRPPDEVEMRSGRQRWWLGIALSDAPPPDAPLLRDGTGGPDAL